MQTASFRIWTRVIMSISNDDDHYPKSALLVIICKPCSLTIKLIEVSKLKDLLSFTKLCYVKHTDLSLLSKLAVTKRSPIVA